MAGSKDISVKNHYSKSPLNYIGNKYKLLPQLIPLFPKEIRTAVDLFAGGCDVIANLKAENRVANDSNKRLIELEKWIRDTNAEDINKQMDSVIGYYGLSKTNKDGYLLLRKDYNNGKDTPLNLFACICYCFNNQMRFNQEGKFNSAFGMNRSSYNDKIRGRMQEYHDNLQGVELRAGDFRTALDSMPQLEKGDFVYCDPPYLISYAYYNERKKGLNGWNKKDDADLFDWLDRLNDRGVIFGMSNLMRHKGKTNEGLLEWSKKYKVYVLDKDYKNCVYCWKPSDEATEEVYITNLEVSE